MEARARRGDKAEKGLVQRRAVRTRPRLPQAEWAEAEDELLLDMRLSELELKIEGSDLEERIAELGKELEAKGLQFRPHFWLADEWFCPDGVPGIAIPFYLAHPRLRRLELTQMLEVEGGTREWCMTILRHEAGHAIENAYKLRQRPKRQAIFGKSSEPYPDSYAPKPYSRSFVVHLDSWYAQSHPDEDFAETFAVWLTPDSNWRERYRGLAGAAQARVRGRADAPRSPGAPRRSPRGARRSRSRRSAARCASTTGRKRRHYRVDARDTYDRDLRALFTDAPEHAGNAPAAPLPDAHPPARCAAACGAGRVSGST